MSDSPTTKKILHSIVDELPHSQISPPLFLALLNFLCHFHIH
jgi:hypothetical protein